MMRMKIIKMIGVLALFTSCHGDFCELNEKYVYCEYTIAKSPRGSRWTSEGKYIPFEVVIGRKVIRYSYDDDYIIAHQIVNNNREEKHRYWVIRLADDMIWGPLPKDSFEMKCKEQKVQVSLSTD